MTTGPSGIWPDEELNADWDLWFDPAQDSTARDARRREADADWNTIFPNAACAVALIDRLTHHAEILAMEGESYRKRDAERAQKARRSLTKSESS